MAILSQAQVARNWYDAYLSRSRHARIIHLAYANAQWSRDNWLQRPVNFPFKRLNQEIPVT